MLKRIAAGEAARCSVAGGTWKRGFCRELNRGDWCESARGCARLVDINLLSAANELNASS